MFESLPVPTAKVFSQFLEYYKTRKLAQVYLLYGPSNALPQEAWLQLAGAILADEEGGGISASTATSYVRKGLHPNFFYLCPEEGEKDITAEQARRLNSFLQTTPALPGWRVVIIQPAEGLNIAASNILLKNMEELPPKTTIFLISESLYKIKKTILSRAQKVFIPSESPSLESYVAENSWTQDVLKSVRTVAAGGSLPGVDDQKALAEPEKLVYFPEVIKYGLHRMVMDQLSQNTCDAQTCEYLSAYERVADFVDAAKGKSLSDAHFILAVWTLLSPQPSSPFA